MTPGFWLQHSSAWGCKEHKGAGCSGQAVVLAVKRTFQGQLSGLDLLGDRDLASYPWSQSTWGLSC